jgi:hypothetical protein
MFGGVSMPLGMGLDMQTLGMPLGMNIGLDALGTGNLNLLEGTPMDLNLA